MFQFISPSRRGAQCGAQWIGSWIRGGHCRGLRSAGFSATAATLRLHDLDPDFRGSARTLRDDCWLDSGRQDRIDVLSEIKNDQKRSKTCSVLLQDYLFLIRFCTLEKTVTLEKDLWLLFSYDTPYQWRTYVQRYFSYNTMTVNDQASQHSCPFID